MTPKENADNILVENGNHWDLTPEEAEALVKNDSIYYCPEHDDDLNHYHLSPDIDDMDPDDIDSLVAFALG